MKVCIIGWYGTETIGDRAILAGLLTLLTEVFSEVTVQLGSLYPFFTDRTVREDQAFWNELTDRALPVQVFDSSSPRTLKKAILQSDLVLVGGGPLMDLREMHMLSFAFRYAHRHQIKTGLFGCGMGPLKKKVYRRAAADILRHADFAVFRDSLSLETATQLVPECVERYVAAVDPAAYCALKFRGLVGDLPTEKHICINLRQVSQEYETSCSQQDFEEFSTGLIQKVLFENPAKSILLLPNHYFFFGGDDRFLLNTIKCRAGKQRVFVQNEPLSLRDTMQVIASSSCCVGMRFHSVVLMTLLNGKCRILNYTGTQTGKISGYLKDFDPSGFFNATRQVSLTSDALDLSIVDGLATDERFEVPTERLESAFQVCRSILRECG